MLKTIQSKSQKSQHFEIWITTLYKMKLRASCTCLSRLIVRDCGLSVCCEGMKWELLDMRIYGLWTGLEGESCLESCCCYLIAWRGGLLESGLSRGCLWLLLCFSSLFSVFFFFLCLPLNVYFLNPVYFSYQKYKNYTYRCGKSTNEKQLRIIL